MAVNFLDDISLNFVASRSTAISTVVTQPLTGFTLIEEMERKHLQKDGRKN